MAEENGTSFNDLFKAYPMPMWVYALDTLAFMAVNTAAIVHYGFSEAEFLALTIADLRPPEELPKLFANLRHAPLDTLEKSGTWRHRKKDGTVIDVEVTSHPLHFNGQACKFVLAHDVTERVEAHRKIARLNRVYALLSGINSAIVRIRERNALFKEACRLATMEGGFVAASIDMAELEGLENIVSAGMALPQRPPNTEHEWIAARAVQARHPIICNVVAFDPNMAAFRDHMAPRGLRAAAAFPLLVGERVVAVLTLVSETPGVFDAEELKILNEIAGDLSFALLFLDREEQLSYLAYYDVMTALPNRRRFQERLTQLLHAGTDGFVAVVLINLDRFAHLNDTMGRHAGDALLVQIARRLGHSLPDAYNVARIGGDTFALSLAHLAGPEQAAEVLQEQVFSALDLPFMLEDQEVRISTRAGLATYPGDGGDAETLFKHAEAALKNAKVSGQRYLYYAPRMNAALAARVALENELQLAIEDRQFEMYYQPRVDLFNGRIVSAEALIRWNHPQRGIISPLEFIGLSEETGLIRPIGAWVIEDVCAQQGEWRRKGIEIVPVAINLSAVQCVQAELLNQIATAMATNGLERKCIEFELTETAVMNNPEDAARNLSGLKALGVQLSLDDFGTGYSSLAQLKRFPFDFVKIDRSFIAGIDSNPEDEAIAGAIIAMAHSLGLKVVAEGVETEAQLAVLRTLRCDEMQGFLFSKPLPAAGFMALVQADKRL